MTVRCRFDSRLADQWELKPVPAVGGPCTPVMNLNLRQQSLSAGLQTRPGIVASSPTRDDGDTHMKRVLLAVAALSTLAAAGAAAAQPYGGDGYRQDYNRDGYHDNDQGAWRGGYGSGYDRNQGQRLGKPRTAHRRAAKRRRAQRRRCHGLWPPEARAHCKRRL